MKPVLRQQFQLLLRSGRAYIERLSDHQLIAALEPVEAVVLGLMNGQRTKDDISILLDSVGRPEVTRSLDILMRRISPLLANGKPAANRYQIDDLAVLKGVDPKNGLRALPGPRVLHWWVTDYCPKKCIYCFANPVHGGHAPDATITRAQLQKIFVEAADLGAEKLLIAGAEPLLRKDLPEVIGDAINAGILPLITTKHRITPDLAQRFARAGLRHISLSLDSLDAKTNETLIGVKNFAQHVRDSMEYLRREDIKYSLQSVVVPQNENTIRDVIRFGADHKAQVVQIVPFEPVLSPIGAYRNDQLDVDRDLLVETAARLQEEYPDTEIEVFEELGYGTRGEYQCDIGMTKMFFLPNGVVHRCYKLTSDDHLRGKDLRTNSVAAAWHDTEFRNIISPPRESYSQVACGSCIKFDGCHEEGRCIYQSFVDHGHYTGPDRHCNGPYRDLLMSQLSRAVEI